MFTVVTIPSEHIVLAAAGPFDTASEARLWGEAHWAHCIWVIVGLLDPATV